MAAEYIEKIQELAGRFRDDERNLTLYFPDLETAPAGDSYNRVFGPPVGLTDDRWPTFPELGELMQQANCIKHWDPRDQRMEHVFTIDLRGIRLLGAPEHAAAMMLFLSNASFHRACADGNRHTEVLFLDHEEAERGLYRGRLPERSLYRWSRRFSLVPIEVPGEVFDVPELDLLPDDLLVELFEAIREAPARLGGCPISMDDGPELRGGWSESTPTLPWSEPQRSSLTIPYAGRSKPRLADSSLTIPYAPSTPTIDESSRTIPYDLRSLDRRPTVVEGSGLLDGGRFDSYADRDPASALTFGHRTTPRASNRSTFLMQFQRRFADVNLGRPGVMYVSRRSAYVPTH
ncbi:MAG: hypothetical protein KC501_17445 [Myxococcales bacterium]|nr:hypothetical protein [Myxococcales bacterium]